MQEKKFNYHSLEEIDMNYEEVVKLVDDLSDIEKRDLVEHLVKPSNSPITVVLGGYNVINNSFSLQLNGDVEKIADQLKDAPPETLQLLLDAIALVVSGNKKSPRDC